MNRCARAKNNDLRPEAARAGEDQLWLQGSHRGIGKNGAAPFRRLGSQGMQICQRFQQRLAFQADRSVAGDRTVAVIRFPGNGKPNALLQP